MLSSNKFWKYTLWAYHTFEISLSVFSDLLLPQCPSLPPMCLLIRLTVDWKFWVLFGDVGELNFTFFNKSDGLFWPELSFIFLVSTLLTSAELSDEPESSEILTIFFRKVWVSLDSLLSPSESVLCDWLDELSFGFVLELSDIFFLEKSIQDGGGLILSPVEMLNEETSPVFLQQKLQDLRCYLPSRQNTL